jgi:hypothetical protein
MSASVGAILGTSSFSAHPQQVLLASLTVAAGSGLTHVISFGSNFANPGPECLGVMDLFVDDVSVAYSIAQVPSGVNAIPGAGWGTGAGWGNATGTWMINDGASHSITMYGRQIGCQPDTLQVPRPFLIVNTLKK